MESCYIALLSICLLNKNQVVQLLLNATKFEKTSALNQASGGLQVGWHGLYTNVP